MLMQIIQIYPVNLLQVAFVTLAIMGAGIIWKSKIYRSLAFFFIYQAVLMLMNFMEETRLTIIPYLITPVFTLLVGPLLYFFVRSLVHEKVLSMMPRTLHLIPMLAALPFTHFTQTVIAFGTFSQIIYLLLSFQLLNRYHKASLAVRSDADSMALTWTVSALAAFAALLVFDLVRLNLQTQATISIDVKMAWYFTDTLLFFGISAFLLFKAIGNPSLFTGMLAYENAVKAGSVKENLGEGKPQDLLTAKALCQNIENIVLDKSMFKQQRLSVNDVADETGLSVKDISWAINIGAQKNFCEFINGLRVQHMQKKIDSGIPKGTKLLELAFESGFSSKSTFNMVFKRELKMTPSQYLQSRAR